MIQATDTTEEDNILRLWNDCHNPKFTDIPSLSDYAPLGKWQTIALEIVDARREDGCPEGVLLKYVLKKRINLLQAATSEDKDLIRVLTGHTPQKHKAQKESALKAIDIQIPLDESACPPLPEALVIKPGMTKGLCPQKDLYVAYSKIVSPEGYERYHDTCFWAMGSAIVARRIYIDLSDRLYTSLFTVLVGDSSSVKKTTTAKVAPKVLAAAGLGWMMTNTKTTPQKLLSDMAGIIPPNYADLSYEDQEDLKIRLAMSAQRGWIYNEYGKAVRAMTRQSSIFSELIELILELDDCPEEKHYDTVIRGAEKICNPYLTILGSASYPSLGIVATKGSELWSDGFFARTGFEAAPPDIVMDNPFRRGEEPVPYVLIKDLRDWHTRLGIPEVNIVPVIDKNTGKATGNYVREWVKPLVQQRMTLSDETYDRWVKYRSALKHISRTLSTKDLDASYERLPILALRVACIAASLDRSSSVEEKHWFLAQEQAESWRRSVHILYGAINSTNSGQKRALTIDEKVLATIAQIQDETEKPVPTREVSRRLHMNMSELDRILSTLTKNGEIRSVPGKIKPMYVIAIEGEE